MICAVATACAGVTVAQTSTSNDQLKSLETWFGVLTNAPAVGSARAVTSQSAEAPRNAIDTWFMGLGMPRPAPSASGRVTDSSDVETQVTQLASVASGPLQLKMEHRFESIKYLVFFTPGSAQLGPIGRKTVALLVPKARQASQVSVIARSDPTGAPELNEVLSRRRGEAIVSALRKGGAVRPMYEVRVDTADPLHPDAQALWKPSNHLGSLRRAMIDVQTERPTEP